MRTECKQVRFEFHQLSQRKVKARFDGGKITSDAGVLLLREVERGTGLIAGLAECFRDHRDARLIEHTVEELLGQRIYGLCLGYEDLNDHDQLRTDPMLAVAVNKADPLGERRRQASDRGKALAGRCTLNRLELTGAEVDEQERYKKIAMDPDRIDGWMVDAFVESQVLDLATARSMASRRPVLTLNPTLTRCPCPICWRPVAIYGARDWRLERIVIPELARIVIRGLLRDEPGGSAVRIAGAQAEGNATGRLDYRTRPDPGESSSLESPILSSRLGARALYEDFYCLEPKQPGRLRLSAPKCSCTPCVVSD